MNDKKNIAVPQVNPIDYSDASMLGPITDYGPGSYQSDRFDERYNGYYGYGATSRPRAEIAPENFSWKFQTPKDHIVENPQRATAEQTSAFWKRLLLIVPKSMRPKLWLKFTRKAAALD